MEHFFSYLRRGLSGLGGRDEAGMAPHDTFALHACHLIISLESWLQMLRAGGRQLFSISLRCLWYEF